MQIQRLQLIIQGQVQGVGFRPSVYRVANRLCLTGWIRNNASGVLIEVQGTQASEFVTHLKGNLPVLAKLNKIQIKPIPLKTDEVLFEIMETEQGRARTIISPDACICLACLQELFDPQSRYFRYPFLNCTDCGPRFSITHKLPYDRCQTSMQSFPLCPSCKTEYSDPGNRRYHAQPTACIDCGPQLSISIDEIAKRILQGEIIALKGLGGYQFICDARNEVTLSKLRERKNRATKPFALMLANTKSAEALVEITEQARTLLEGRARPIVLLRKKKDLAGLADRIAPGLNHLGIMLPYTPIHYLLFNAFAGNVDASDWLDEFQSTILVVTSANSAADPIVTEDYKAEIELPTIADKIVSYNRYIISREDDSVLRIINDAPMLIRRARGFVPEPIQLPYSIPATVAVGGHLKNTFCITRGDEAFVSQHIGSLNNKATIDFFHESLNHFLKLLSVKPEQIAHDLHPDFYTSRLAEDWGIPAFAIQHHHAHLASVIAEFGIQKPILGLALDGYGYGLNGEAWGGELLLLKNASFERIGSFYPMLQPGGERAAREPWRMAASIMHRLGRANEISKRFPGSIEALSIQIILDKKIHCPATSSCGRLFDAASALLGVQWLSQYEGQAAMRLESLVTQLQVLPNGFQIKNNYFDMLPTLAILMDEADPVVGANIFHGTLIAGLTVWIKGLCREKRIDMVALSGGCFLNQILAEGLTKALRESGIEPLLPKALPPNDGGVSLGQAWIAGIQGG